MGNIGQWAGPLSSQWISSQLTLYQQILRRMRDLGMSPVIPGFTGFVPKEITRSDLIIMCSPLIYLHFTNV